MKPQNLKSRIFLDSGDPEETQEAIKLLGFLDGQTTNPSLVGKHPEVQKRLIQGKKFTREKIYDFYKEIVGEISSLIPSGSVSIEVYADKNTSSKEMLQQGRLMFSWIPNAHIKFPTTIEGLKAAEQAAKQGIRINMTLCFTQEQATAVYGATKGCKRGDVFVSPFIGRLDDQRENGMDLIVNIIRVYEKGDHHIEVLTASVRTIDHFLYALYLESDIITVPLSVLKTWKQIDMKIPDSTYTYNSQGLKPIPYKELNLDSNWQSITFAHPLLDAGLEKFAADWNKLIE